jgi:hypothetical protein
VAAFSFRPNVQYPRSKSKPPTYLPDVGETGAFFESFKSAKRALALLEKGRCLSEGAAGEIKAPKSTKKEEQYRFLR